MKKVWVVAGYQTIGVLKDRPLAERFLREYLERILADANKMFDEGRFLIRAYFGGKMEEREFTQEAIDGLENWNPPFSRVAISDGDDDVEDITIAEVDADV